MAAGGGGPDGDSGPAGRGGGRVAFGVGWFGGFAFGVGWFGGFAYGGGRFAGLAFEFGRFAGFVLGVIPFVVGFVRWGGGPSGCRRR